MGKMIRSAHDFKIALLGSTGMLGIDVNATLKKYGFSIQNYSSVNLDITNIGSVMSAFRDLKPDYIVNCAAFTDIDLAETEKDKAEAVNNIGAKNIAEAALELHSRLIHISIDCVFDGTKHGQYNENDITNPINEYGLSKLGGENSIINSGALYIIVRTQWLYGKNGKNFVNTILKLADTQKKIEVVNDQYGSPTYTKDIAYALCEIITKDNGLNETYHLTNSGSASWFEFAVEIVNVFKRANCEIVPVLSDKFIRPAKRPKNSVFDCSKIRQHYKIELRDWKAALKKYCYDIGYFMR
jgi:dTDP-4-dehydrorhamnose reductase